TEADQLAGIAQVRPAFVVFAFKPGHIDQYLFRRRPPRQRRNGRGRMFFFYGTGHGFISQISDAYSAMVRSLENFPELATFKIAMRPHIFGSAYVWHSR